MKIIGPNPDEQKTFSSRWKDLPRVLIEVEDEAGGTSIYEGYDKDGEPIVESLHTPSPELTVVYAQNAVAALAKADAEASDKLDKIAEQQALQDAAVELFKTAPKQMRDFTIAMLKLLKRVPALRELDISGLV